MPYFFILPAFALYLLAMIALLVITSLHGPASHWRPYVLSVLVWSSAGFVLSTVVYFGVVVATFGAMSALLDEGSVIRGVIGGGLLFIAPFVAAAGGVAGGAVFGVWRRIQRSRARPD